MDYTTCILKNQEQVFEIVLEQYKTVSFSRLAEIVN